MVSSKPKQTTKVNLEVSAESTDRNILMSPDLVSTDSNTDTKGLSFEDANQAVATQENDNCEVNHTDEVLNKNSHDVPK